MTNKLSVFISAVIGVILGSVITLVAIVPFGNDINVNANKVAKSDNHPDKEVTETISPVNKDYVSLYKDIAQSAMPSVVGVTTEFIDNSNYGDIYSFMFGFGFEDTPRVVHGVGTGVIVDSDGYILTNSHVVEDGKVEKVNVLLNDGSQKKAKVQWTDKNLDLAIIKIDGSDYPVAKLGDSDKIEVGDIAVAIGNPMGLEFDRSVTQGIVSGLGRTISSPEIGSMSNLIQTDASINRGNSGGPLLNSDAEVIGINTIKVGGEGLGFSIPINTAKIFINILKENGEIREKPVLGVTGISLSQILPDIKENIDSDSGVYILEVLKNSSADKAGLKEKDIIIKLNDDEIKNMSDLQEGLYKYGQNDKTDITLTIIRDGKELTKNVTLSSKNNENFEPTNEENQENSQNTIEGFNDLLRLFP